MTNGHLDLIARGAMIFDRLVVAVTQNLGKGPALRGDERIEMLEAVTREWKNVEVERLRRPAGGLRASQRRAA